MGFAYRHANGLHFIGQETISLGIWTDPMLVESRGTVEVLPASRALTVVAPKLPFQCNSLSASWAASTTFGQQTRQFSDNKPATSSHDLPLNSGSQTRRVNIKCSKAAKTHG